MFQKTMAGRLFGIPIVIDSSILLLAILWLMPNLGKVGTTGIMISLFVFVGLVLSILLHELGHAFAGWVHGIRASHIELNGLGGLCYWATSLPGSRRARIEISLAGPAVNFALFVILTKVSEAFDGDQHELLANVLWRVGYLNFVLMVFNLLPSHPLDGGKALAALISWPLGSQGVADRIVAWLGMGVVALLALAVLRGDTFALIVGLMLFVSNKQMLDSTPPFSSWWGRRG